MNLWVQDFFFRQRNCLFFDFFLAEPRIFSQWLAFSHLHEKIVVYTRNFSQIRGFSR